VAGDGVVFAWEDEEFQKLCQDAIDRVENAHPAMKSFAEYMVTRTADRFRDEEAPDGSDWDKLKPITLLRKQRRKPPAIDKILHQDGYLRLVHPHADDDSSGVYSYRIYAAIHNRGGMAGRGHRVKIPKREFLGFNQEDILEFKETVADYIVLGRK